MELDKIHSVYFIGIGGIGMSALARWFNVNSYKVSGYDRTSTKLTKELEAEGINIHYEDNIKLISADFLDIETTLVVYTPAIPEEHTELNYFKLHHFPLKKRAEVLGMLTQKMFTIAVAGTHGKTTTSSMIAHLLKASGKDCAAFLGGITQNYNTNLLLNRGKEEESIVVLEADEYDRSFLKLFPDIAVITSMDADHLDIYENAADFTKTFNDFVKQIKPTGHLFYRDNTETLLDENRHISSTSFGTKAGKYTAENIRIENGDFVFNAKGPDLNIADIRLTVPGYHNVENALAAIAVGHKLNIKEEAIRKALGSFKGVKRRFEYHLKNEHIIYIDDYAHHPTEINAFLSSMKAVYPGKKMTVIFQPHLFTRTRDFMEGFAESLALADQLILLEIYPARELPIPGITSKILLEKIKIKDKILCAKDQLLKEVEKLETDIIVTIGAGDIDEFINPIKESLLNKKYV